MEKLVFFKFVANFCFVLFGQNGPPKNDEKYRYHVIIIYKYVNKTVIKGELSKIKSRT